jgi:hypothetical protein
VLLPVIERYRDREIPKYFRGDSAFALPKLLNLSGIQSLSCDEDPLIVPAGVGEFDRP